MALNNHILTIIEPSIKLDEFNFKSFNEEGGDNKVSPGYGTDRVPFVVINGYVFHSKSIKNLEIRCDNTIPTIELSVIDLDSKFSVDTFPRDGDVINVRIGSRQIDQYKDLRIDFDIDKVDTNLQSSTQIGTGGCKYNFFGKMKIPGMFAEQCKSYEKSTSLDHLEKIADDLKIGLATNIDASDDAMQLLVAYQPMLEVIENLVKHSYVDENSFQTYAIDPYYYLNYVNMNKLLNSEEDLKEDVILGLIDNFNDEVGQDNATNEIKTNNILTNHPRAKNLGNYVGRYALDNKSGNKVKKNGYKKTLQFFEDDSPEKLVSFDVEPLTSDNLKDIEEPLRGRKDEDRYKKEVKFKYVGRKDTDPDTANTHLNYIFSEIHNKQNLEEIDKLSLNIELPTFNASLHRFQKVPVIIFQLTNQQTGADHVLKKKKEESGFKTKPKKDFQGSEIADNSTVDEFLTGFYVINSIIYKYNKRDGKVRQELNLIRREWPSRINNLG